MRSWRNGRRASLRCLWGKPRGSSSLLDRMSGLPMSHAVARQTMTAAEFLAWDLGQPGRHELVDGVPSAMTGARQRHDRVVVNLLAALHRQLRGGPCRAFTADTAV